MQALIFANGDANDGIAVRQALHTAVDPLIIAADGGARVAAYYGCAPQVVIGDMDSLTPDELLVLREAGAAVYQHPIEKDETDLELALKYAAAQGVTWIRIFGGLGDRFDQTIANVYLLALPELTGCDVQLLAGRQAITLLSAGSHTLQGAPGDTVSLIPLDGDVHGIRTENLYYPLRGETLAFGPARGVSNVMQEDIATVTFDSGLLLVVHTSGKA